MIETMPDKPATIPQNSIEPETIGRPTFAEKTKIHWNVWAKRDSVKLWEAVALSKNIPPRQLPKAKERSPVRYRNYQSRLKTVISWLNTSLNILDHPSNGTEPHDQMVLLTEFVRCALSKNVQLPQKMLEITTATKESLENPTEIRNKHSSKKSPELIARNQELQSTAEALVEKLKSEKKLITKRKVATLLHNDAKWSDLEIATIERNISITR